MTIVLFPFFCYIVGGESVIETGKEGAECLENRRRSFYVEGPRASNVVFSSMPAINANGQAETVKGPGLQNQQHLYGDLDGKAFGPKKYESATYNGSSGEFLERYFLLSQCYSQRSYFAPYWSKDAVHEALEVSCCLKNLQCQN